MEERSSLLPRAWLVLRMLDILSSDETKMRKQTRRVSETEEKCKMFVLKLPEFCMTLVYTY